MTPERWARVKAIVAEALDQKPKERERFVAETCESDAELIGEVRRLLEQEETGSHLSPLIDSPSPDLSGQTVGHYRIERKIGAGGMGVVYKAEDTKLHRTVALKFLRKDAVERPDLKARFLTEAEAVAALDHPNVCTIYEIGETEGQPFLAMAYVEGESLAEKIRKRPLPLKEALDIAAQMAEGLAAAHKKGIVHRDIKSANVMVNPEGRVKIMDFGLAQLVDRVRITQTGMIIGTPAYMSPEQIRGEPVDQRTDIWSLGVVIYEMVSGQLPFRGGTPQSVASDIQSGEPELLTWLRAGVPLELELIVGKALEKLREERYQHVDEMLVDLKGLGRKLVAGKSTVGSGGLRGSRRRRWKQATSLLAVGVAAVGLGAVAALSLRPEPARIAPLRKFTLHPREGATSAEISPDGKHIAYTTGSGDQSKLWIHDLDQLEPRRIDGADGADWPFWSPDSRFVGFVAAGELRKVPEAGGAVATISRLPSDRTVLGGTWSPDGATIAFSQLPHIYEVPARGGNPRILIEAGGEIEHFEEPKYLPASGGYRLLLQWRPRKGGHNVGSRSPETGELHPLCPAECVKPSYSPSGHVLLMSWLGDALPLWAAPFSVETMKKTGELFLVAVGCFEPSVSLDGTLVCLEDPEYWRPSRLVWWDRKGHQISSVGEPISLLGGFNLSRNGERVAVSDWGTPGILVYDLRKNTGYVQPGPLEAFAVPFAWSPSGDSVAFRGRSKGGWDIFVVETDGRGDVRPLHCKPLDGFPWDWSADGSILVYGVGGQDVASHDLWYLKVNSSGQSATIPFLQTPAQESQAKLSPDGRFVAYESNQTGRAEVYVQRFPGGGGTRQISPNGGNWPRWRRDGRELFYVEGETLVAVTVAAGPEFAAGSPERLFRHPSLAHAIGIPSYDPSPDGQRFLLAAHAADAPPTAIRVVQNWYAEFKDQQSPR